MLQPHRATYPAGILCLSSGKLSTPLFPKDNQHTDIIFRLSLVPSASPGLRLYKDPEVVGDVYSLYLSKAGKEKWHRTHTLERQNYCQFLCKDGTSSPSSLLGARGKSLALSSSQAQPRRKEASSPSSPCISKLPRKCSRSPCTQHTPEKRGTEGHPQPSSVTGWLLLLAPCPCPSLRRGFALVTREQGTPPPAPPRRHLPLPARTRGTSTSRARIPPRRHSPALRRPLPPAAPRRRLLPRRPPRRPPAAAHGKGTRAPRWARRRGRPAPAPPPAAAASASAASEPPPGRRRR